MHGKYVKDYMKYLAENLSYRYVQYHACWKLEMYTNCCEKMEAKDSDVLRVLGSDAKKIPHVMNAG